jgi:hypothetical protein
VHDSHLTSSWWCPLSELVCVPERLLELDVSETSDDVVVTSYIRE